MTSPYTKAYFIGIGGIGMSALAQLMQDQGVVVEGSDREASPVTELLEAKGISVALVQDARNVPVDADIVVYSDAVWEDNVERVRATELNIPQHSYFSMLGTVSKGKRTIAVAGTHGKTTTTGMLAKILRDGGAHPTAVVGSLMRDFNSNYTQGTSDLFVVEACEYRNHFLELSPSILVVTNVEWDHTDYFKSFAEFQAGFRRLMEKTTEAIVTDTTHPNIAPLLEGLSVEVIEYQDASRYNLALPGEFNQMNARAAAAAARLALPTLSSEVINSSLADFKGTWRRFEYKGKTQNGADVYDDYAHHPTAIRKTLEVLHERLTATQTPGGNHRITVAFHPHLYSRTRDLLDEFATAFANADEVIIAPIYPAREVDDGTMSNTILAERITQNGVSARALDSFDDIEAALKDGSAEGDIVVTMGAGDIYKVADKLVVYP